MSALPRNVRHIIRYKGIVFENTSEYKLEKEVKQYIRTFKEFNTDKKVNNEWWRVCEMVHKKEDKIDE